MPEAVSTFPISVVLALIALVGGIAYVVAAKVAGSRATLPSPTHEGRYELALAAMCAVYVAVSMILSLIRYAHLHCGLYDLGIFDTVVWNLTRGRFFQDFRGASDHLSPIFLICVPFYWLWDDPRTLLVLQSFVLGGAAVPLYLCARALVGDPRPALVLAGAYLLHPLVSRVNLYDFHAAAFHPLAFFFTCYCFAKGRWVELLLAAAASLMVKEDAAALVFGLGLFALLDRRRRWPALALMAMAAVWGLFAMEVYFPLIRGRAFAHYGRYPPLLGPTAEATVRNVAAALAAPFAKSYVWKTAGLLLLPVAFLPLARPWACLTILGAAWALSFFSCYWPQQVLRGHYGATVIPGLFIAASYGYRRLWRAQPRVRPAGVAAAVVACAVLCNFFFADPAFERYHDHALRPYRPAKHLTLLSIPRKLPSPVLRWHQQILARLARTIPEPYSVMAQNSLGYLFTRRERLLEVDASREADFYIFDLQSSQGHTSPKVYQQVLRGLADSPRHERFLNAGGITCFCRRGLAAALHDQMRQAWQREPDSRELHYLLGAISFTRGDLDAAQMHLGHLAQSGQVDAASVETLWMLADVYARRGRDELAVQTLMEGLALAPNCGPAHAALARLYRQQGKPDKARGHESRAPR